MRKKHSINIIFPILLFFIFASCSFILIVDSVNTYKRVETQETNEYKRNTPFFYFINKIRGNDASHVITIQTIDNISCLVIETEQNKNIMYTKDRTLYELLVPKDREISLIEASKVIEDIDPITFTQNAKRTITLTTKDKSQTIYLRNEGLYD